mmetsp:Transcript_18047/g.50136  ORF Transcript_18047/g.50136 Transcript_18047/m.50136 type:complete len:572 (+) Transcript_18047:201-1916(+)
MVLLLQLLLLLMFLQLLLLLLQLLLLQLLLFATRQSAGRFPRYGQFVVAVLTPNVVVVVIVILIVIVIDIVVVVVVVVVVILRRVFRVDIFVAGVKGRRRVLVVLVHVHVAYRRDGSLVHLCGGNRMFLAAPYPLLQLVLVLVLRMMRRFRLRLVGLFLRLGGPRACRLFDVFLIGRIVVVVVVVVPLSPPPQGWCCCWCWRWIPKPKPMPRPPLATRGESRTGGGPPPGGASRRVHRPPESVPPGGFGSAARPGRPRLPPVPSGPDRTELPATNGRRMKDRPRFASSSSSSPFVDESFVLPIVSQLDGEPRVTEEGDIIYVFPDLQVSASSANILPQVSESAMLLKRAGLRPDASSRDIQNLLVMNGISTRGAREKADLMEILESVLPEMTEEEEAEVAMLDPTLLLEREYKFSLASGVNKFFAGALGIANLGGVLYLGNLFHQYQLYNVKLPGFLGLAQTLYPGLVVYAVLFNLIPLARNLWISKQNAEIQGRNRARRKWRELARSKGSNVLRKLKAAAKFATNRKILKGEDAVYDTKKDSASSLQAKKDQMDLDEFDRLLNDDKNTFQ